MVVQNTEMGIPKKSVDFNVGFVNHLFEDQLEHVSHSHRKSYFYFYKDEMILNYLGF